MISMKIFEIAKITKKNQKKFFGGLRPPNPPYNIIWGRRAKNVGTECSFPKIAQISTFLSKGSNPPLRYHKFL